MHSYHVAIMPTGAVYADITKLKNALKNSIGNYSGAASEASIILFAFQADEAKLNLFNTKIQLVCNTIEPFEIVCKNFGEFYLTKTIYVALEEVSESRILSFRKKLSAQLKNGKYDMEVDFDAGKNPHITLGRKLTDIQYKSATKFFMNTSFSGSFICNKLVLRKLSVANNFTKYVAIKDYAFAKQNLSLF